MPCLERKKQAPRRNERLPRIQGCVPCRTKGHMQGACLLQEPSDAERINLGIVPLGLELLNANTLPCMIARTLGSVKPPWGVRRGRRDRIPPTQTKHHN